MTTLVTRNPIAVAMPRGASWAASAWIALSHVGAQIWASRLQRAASSNGDNRLSEANRLRRVAQGFMATDSRFAADLFAAADRHERAE